MRAAAFLTTVLLCGACATAADRPAPAVPSAGGARSGAGVSAGPAPGRAAQAEATSIAARFQQELGAKLQSALAAGGPVAAIDVCHAEAPAMAARISRESGWNVRRVGTRVRNPASGRPDAWEQAQLDAFARRLAAGEPAETLDVHAVVDEGGVATQRYMRAIVTAPLCLVCHGEPLSQPADVRARLRERYPDDDATGYRAGELRGAFTLRRPAGSSR